MYRIRKPLLLLALFGGIGAPVSLAQAQTLATTTANNGSGGVFMDLTPAAGSLLVTSFESYFSSTAGGASTLEVWTRPGTYVGFDGDPTGWTLHDTVNAISAGTATLAPITLNTPIVLPGAQTTAVYIQGVSGQTLRYTGTSAAPPQTTWSNAELTLFSDVARTGSVSFGGTRNSPRTFAGVVHYIPNDPTPGACCLNDGSCTSVSHAECIGQGGSFHGAGTTCATVPCPQPAACCFPSGACSVLLETQCNAQGGTFNSTAATCAIANCPQPPTGACCLPTGGCVIDWVVGCTGQGGIYAGDNTTCATATCTNVVVPNEFAAVEGPTNNNIPFTSTIAHYHWQQVQAASEFSGISGPHQITEIRLRPNVNSTFQPWSETVNMTMIFSTTAVQPDDMSLTFAENLGADAQIVHQGPLTISTQQSSSSPFPPGPLFFDIVIPLATPFVYDPANGNLIIDVVKDGAATASRPLDAVSVVGDGVSRLISSVVGSPTGTASSVGLVTLFILEPATGSCYANCDGSTLEPVLNVADFGCFLTKFAAGDPYANCDGSTLEPVLNVADFGCFLTKFAAGCQ